MRTLSSSSPTTETLTYDANGNLAGWAGTSFAHDSQGQLTNVTTGGQSTGYQYDYRRLRVSGGSGASPSGYTYDAAGNLFEISNPTGPVQYVYGDRIDDVVLLRSDGDLYALVTDHLGSVVAILNGSGNVEATYDYSPFGKTTVTGDPKGNTLGFTGREIGAGGLYYYRNRWYSPELGRFLEPDPIGLAGWDLNLYRYVGNEPLRWLDPWGINGFHTGTHPPAPGYSIGITNPVMGIVVSQPSHWPIMPGNMPAGVKNTFQPSQPPPSGPINIPLPGGGTLTINGPSPGTIQVPGLLCI